MSSNRKLWGVAFGSGLLFALALGIGGMTLPERVMGFLDFTGAWDPTLAAFMAGAVGTFFVLNRARRRWQRPLLGEDFLTPTPPRGADRRLIGGSALFGFGWGLVGFCPAPALTSLATGSTDVLIFAVAMVGGMALHSLVEGRAPRAATTAPVEASAHPAETELVCG